MGEVRREGILGMAVDMTKSVPDDVSAFVKAKGNASAHTARIMRRQMLATEVERSAQVRAAAGITALSAEHTESEEDTLARWGRVAGR